jgi:hypothetical protein
MEAAQSPRDVDPHERRLILVASRPKASEISGRVHWGEVWSGHTLPLACRDIHAPFITIHAPLPSLVCRMLKKTRQALPYPVLDPAVAREVFRFPVGHPIEGVTYACSQTDPLFYVPLAGYHRYMYAAKLAAFEALCVSLGVQRTSLVYCEEDGTQTASKAFAEYPAPQGPLFVPDTAWLSAEPTWSSMCQRRLEGQLERCQAELSWVDSQGIDADVVGKISGLGLKIGGAFERFIPRRSVFEVTFWPRAQSGMV